MSDNKKLDLQLGDSGNEEHPRRLLRIGKHLIAYGGEERALVEILSSSNDNDGDDDKVRLIGHHESDFNEDAIRCVAVSHDGRRLAVGTDNGSTLVYAYDDFVAGGKEDENSPTAAEHPFVVSSVSSSSRKPWAGPTFDGSIVRDMQFYPNSYRLAIASEGTGFCVLDVTSKDSISDNKRYLEDESKKEHKGGVRGLCFCRVGKNKSGKVVLLASLGLDGRLCLWDVSSPDKPEEWSLLKREDVACVTKNDVGEYLGSDTFDRSCRPHFMTASKMLALPGESWIQLRSFETTTGSSNVTIKQWDLSSSNEESKDGNGSIQGHIQSMVAITSSPKKNDHYLITSGRDGRVVLWSITPQTATNNGGDVTAQFVRQLGTYESPPTDLLWDVDEEGTESLKIACADAYLFTLKGRENIAPPPTIHKTKETSSNQHLGNNNNAPKSKDGSQLETPSPSRSPDKHRFSKKKSKKTDDFEDSDDDDDVFGSDDQQTSPPKNRFFEDEAAEDNDSIDGDKNKPPSPAGGGDRSPATTSHIDNGGASNRRFGDDSSASSDDDDGGFNHVQEIASTYARENAIYGNTAPPAPKLPDPQPAFAPSSTPLDLVRRFLCWNHIGSCTHLQGEAGSNLSSVNIDFTDSAFRRPITFPDNLGFILGSLGEDGAVFATATEDDDDNMDEDDDDDVVNGLHMSEMTRAAVKRSRKGKQSKPTGSKLFFHRYETFGARRDKDWFLTLPDGEGVLGCSCGEGWAAVMTSRRFLRTFTSGGNQGQVIWLPGQPVTMAGRGRYLAVFYHEAPPLADGTNQLGYTFYDAITNKIISKGSASCISSGATLDWAGFSNDNSLMTLDSDGVVSMLVGSSCFDGVSGASTPPSWEWVPILDTVGLRKSSDDSYWPVTSSDGKLISVLLKGGTKHPDATRKPVTTALNLRMPLARGSLAANANALEELSIRASIALNQKRVFHDLVTNGAEDEDFENEYHALSAQVDKVTLKMFAGVIEAGKLERALDLVERLHLEKSYDLAITIADNHSALADLIEDAKDRKFGGPPDVPAYTDDAAGYGDEEDEEGEYDDYDSSQRITPDSQRKRSMNEFADNERHVRSRKAGFA